MCTPPGLRARTPHPCTAATPAGIHTSTTAISFRVSVPVLSVQMNVVEPSVSTASRWRTSAWRAAIRCAPIASDNVTVGSRPSGTTATVTPTANRKPSDAFVPTRREIRKNPTPTPIATAASTRETRSELEVQRRGRRLLRVREACDAREPRARAGCDHDGTGLALDDEATREHGLTRVRMMRHALAGQRRRVDGERVDGLEREISRDPVALGEQHDVPDDELLGGDLVRQAVADDGHSPRQQVPQALGRVLGPLFLHEREHAVQHDHEEDGDAELGQARNEGEEPGDPEQQGEEVHHLGGQPPPRRRAGRHGKLVRSVAVQARRRLGGRQASATWSPTSLDATAIPAR